MTRFAPLWLQSGSYAASVDRRLIGALWPTARCDGGAVTPSGTGMAVEAAPGSVAVPAANATGSVLCTWDAPETVNLDPAPPAGTNRIDLIVCQVMSPDVGGTGGEEFLIVAVKGAEAATAVAPAVPPNAVPLCQIAIAGGSASIVAGNITNRRPGSLAAGELVFANAGERNAALPNPSPGMRCWLLDTDTPWVFRDGGWRGLPLGVINATRLDAPGFLHATYITLVNTGMFTVKAGRRYSIDARIYGGQVTAAGNLTMECRDWDTGDELRRTMWTGWLVAGVNVVGQSVSPAVHMTYDAPTTRQKSWQITGSVSAGEWRPSHAFITVQDIGSP